MSVRLQYLLLILSNSLKFLKMLKKFQEQIYKDLKTTSILLYALLCDRLSISYTNENKDKNLKNKLLKYVLPPKFFCLYSNTKGRKIVLIIYVKKQQNLLRRVKNL